MKYTSFRIKNFKGINELELVLNKIPSTNVFTLVGLNESGKTTILEAIDSFKNPVKTPNSIIPKSKRANFNDNIEVEAKFLLESNDLQKIADFLKTKKYLLEPKQDTISITKILKYDKSSFQSESKRYSHLFARYKTSKSAKSLYSSNNALWQELFTFIQSTLMPTIVYYPNFLFDFPTKIYLEEYSGESAEQPSYRLVLQDILNSLGQDLKIKEHLVDRKRANSSNDLENIEKVLNAMAGKISTHVFDAWKKVSGIKVGNISVTLGNDIKMEKNESLPEGDPSREKLYIEIKIKEGTDSYFIKERSLGFRWFFAFLLFTQFRKFRENEVKNTLFLLDEPASNLHQTGQEVLLDSLEPLTHGSMVIYSTHSHHLINPKWLSGAFIVKNNGLDIEKKFLEENFNDSKTDINADRYYSFVAKYPNDETHYKPILDVLDYKPSRLELVPKIVIPEGKFDFYIFNYIQELYLRRKTKINFYPGAGRDKHPNIISLYLSWGRDFIVLLDSDKGGEESKEKYLKDFGKICEDKIFTLIDINKSFKDFTTEDLISEKERVQLMQTIFPLQKTYDKSKFNSAIQELFISGKKFTFSKESMKNFELVFKFIDSSL